MATATQTLTASGTWTAPAGVTSVLVTPTYQTFDQYAGQGTEFVFNDQSGLSYGWGGCIFGQFGRNIASDSINPPAVILGGIPAYKMFAALPSSGAFFYIGRNGVTYACGDNIDGYLGVGDVTARSTPTAVVGGISFKEVVSFRGQGATNRASTLGIASDGTLFAWGSNQNGQLGVGDTTPRSSPVQVLGNYKFKQVFVTSAPSHISGNIFSCYGITFTGDIYAWGNNIDGQLGLNDAIPRSSPALVVGSQNWQKFDVTGNDQSIAAFGLNTAGAVYSWGQNSNGIRGDGGAVFKTSSPGLVAGSHVFTDITVSKTGQGTAFGIKANGQVWGWGWNAFGGLGNGNITTQQTPSQVIGSLNIKQVYNNNNLTTFFLTTSNDLYAAGYNLNGQLGNNSLTPVSSPALVIGGISWNKMLRNGSYNIGISNSGSLYYWSSGGTGSIPDRSSPTLIVGATLKTSVESFGPMPTNTRITVIPNTSYPVTFSNELSTFGTTPIASGTISALTIEYEQ